MKRAVSIVALFALCVVILACSKGVVKPAKDPKELSSELCKAVDDNNADAVAKLLSEGADPNRISDKGWTAIHWAARAKKSEILDILLANGGDANAPDDMGTVPLLTAAASKRIENMETLLNSGVSVGAAGLELGRKVLGVAVLLRNVEMARLLMKYGANPFLPGTELSPLCMAIGMGYHDMVSCLLESPFVKRDIDTVDQSGRTALNRALLNGESDIAITLLKSGADPSRRDATGNNAIDDAARRNDITVLRYLETLDIDLSKQHDDGTTALHIAAQANSVEALELLISHGAAIDAVDKNGDTPLHKAVIAGSPGCIRSLLVLGANRNILNKAGFVPRDLARDDETRKLFD